MYLWIDSYKAIGEEDFNFSSQYRCSYDRKKNKFYLDDSYISPIQNFFGQKLSISLVVGENGSGKSSLLEVIDLILKGDEIPFEYFLVYSDGNYKTNLKKIPQHQFLVKNQKKIYLSQYSAENASIYQSLHKNISIHAGRGSEILALIFKYQDKYESNIFSYKPSKIQINLKDPQILYNNFIKYINELTESYINGKDNDIDQKGLWSKLDHLDRLIKNSSKLLYKDPFSNLFFDTLLDVERYDFLSAIDILLEAFNESFSEFGYGFFTGLDKLREKELTDKWNIDKYEELLAFILKVNQNDDLISEQGVFIRVEEISGDDRETLLYNYDYLSFEFTDELDRRYIDLSHGEKTIFSIINHIHMIIDDYQRTDTYLFLFDEVEMSLHPRWQIALIEELNSFFSNTKNDIQIIFTTHSPLLTSDVPAGNIIYMEKVNNICRVKKQLSIDEMTFGANLYTLLSKSFFLDEGAMGHFSRKKINSLLDFLDVDTNIDKHSFEDDILNSEEVSIGNKKAYVKDVISMIGEPFLREKMLDMFSRKFDAGNYRRREYLLAKQNEIKLALEDLDND